jgi:hypothetical protein
MNRMRHEPVEADLPVNDLLDRIESEVIAVIDAGGELALRTRIDRLLPPASNTNRMPRSKRHKAMPGASP